MAHNACFTDAAWRALVFRMTRQEANPVSDVDLQALHSRSSVVQTHSTLAMTNVSILKQAALSNIPSDNQHARDIGLPRCAGITLNRNRVISLFDQFNRPDFVNHLMLTGDVL